MAEGNQFEIFEELGRGATTVVYRGYDVVLGRDVAIKQLDDQQRDDAALARQFLRDARFLAQFDHEHILRVYSVDAEHVRIVTELMKSTLAEPLAGGSMDAKAVRRVVCQMLNALSFLHSQGKIHGAVRPGNILINEQGIAKLSDFAATDGGLRVPAGSKKYVAPEVLRNDLGDFGPAFDLYCLGFTALELLVGPRFDSEVAGKEDQVADADVAWLRWHTSDEPCPATQSVCKDAPSDLAAAIDAMLCKRVDARPRTAEDVLAMLDDADAAASTGGISPSAQVTRAPSPAPISGFDKQPRNDDLATTNRQSPSTRDSLNAFLGKPYVLWPLCLAMLGGALWLGLRLRDGGNVDQIVPPSNVQVRLRLPADAADVQLEVDGQPVSLGEDLIVALPPGDRRLRLTATGFEPYDESFIVQSETKLIEIPLQRAPEPLACVLVRVDPPGDDTQILWNGEPSDRDENGRYQMPPGNYQLSVGRDGFVDHLQQVDVAAGEDTIHVQLVSIAPPASTEGQVSLRILPGSEASVVFWDGAPASPSEGQSYALPPGSHELTVLCPGFEAYRQHIVVDGGPQTVEVSLVPGTKDSRLQIDIEPRFLPVIFVDGEKVELSPDNNLTVNAGVHRLQVSQFGYDDFDELITVGEPQDSVRVQLTPQAAMAELAVLHFDIGPVPGAKIWLNGKDVAPNTHGVHVLDPGQYKLRVMQDGYEEHFDELELTPGFRRIRVVMNKISRKPPPPNPPKELVLPKVRFTLSPPGTRLWVGAGDSLQLVPESELADTFDVQVPFGKPIDVVARSEANDVEQVHRFTWQQLVDRKFRVAIDLDPTADVIDLQGRLRAAFEQKMANQYYVAWKSRPGLPTGFQHFREEEQIKEIRDELAARRRPPKRTKVTIIPFVKTPPDVDGKIVPREWRGARRTEIGIDGHSVTMYSLHDGRQLYHACEVPVDTTAEGYDQFRAYFHVNLTPFFKNERFHVRRTARASLGGIRETTLRWTGRAPTNENEAWMKYPISDWRIYRNAFGASSLNPHRQFEMVMDLEECGLVAGRAFAVWFEAESDPTNRGRKIVGRLGDQDSPQWFKLQPALD